MLSAKRAVLAGTTRRTYLAELGNYYLWGNTIINKDLSVTSSPTKSFSPVEVATDDDNTWNSWSGIRIPFSLLGDNGKGIMTDYTPYFPANHPNVELTYSATSDFDYAPYFDSLIGDTAGKRFTAMGGILAEVLSNGELSVKRSFQYYPTGTYSSAGGYQINVYATIISESTDYFYLELYQPCTYSSYYQNQLVLIKIHKRTYVATLVFNMPDGSYGITHGCKRLRLYNNKIVYVTYYNCPNATNQAYSGSNANTRYIFVDLLTNTVTYSATYVNVHEGDTVVQVRSVPSPLTVDKSQAGKLKFYAAGGPLNPADVDLAKRDCKIYRFTLTSGEVNVNEVPEKQLCTLSGLPQGYLISPTQTTITGTWLNANYTTNRAGDIRSFIVTSNSKEYVIFYTRPSNLGIDPTYGFTLARQYLIVFQVSDADSKVLIYKNRLAVNGFGTNQLWYALLTSPDKKTLVWYNAQGYLPMKWNATTETFDIGPVTTAAFDRISLDTNNQLFLEDPNSRRVSIYNLASTNLVDVQFENNVTSADYTGTPISQNLLVNAYDAMNVRVVRTVNLTLTGNAVFTVGGGVTKSVTTSASANTVVAITINGSGSISVTPSL